MQDQLAALRDQLAHAQAELVEREAELIDLRIELSAFRLQYEVQVGRPLAMLAELEAEVDRCQKQIEFYRQWGKAGPPRTRDGSEYVSVEEQYRRTWRDPPPPGPSIPPPPPSLATRQALKALYRQLCRRFHPDLTQDPQERAWRTEQMAAINAAYEAQDLTELQALAALPDRAAGREPTLSVPDRLARLRQQLEQAQRRLRAVGQEIHDLTHSPLLELSLEVKLAARKGRDLLAEMAAQAGRDLARKQAELDFLRAQLRQVGLARE